MPAGVRIDASPEQLAERRPSTPTGSSPRSPRTSRTARGADDGVDERRALRRRFDEGRMVYWSRSRQELWRKGDTSGDRQFVREAYYDCDGDTLLFLVEQEGAGACHTGELARASSAPSARRRRRDRVVTSGRPATSSTRSPASTPSCRCGARCSPTSRRRSPRSPSSSATSRASCSSRSSTASGGAGSRSSAATRRRRWCCATGGRRSTASCPTSVPTDRGMLAAIEALLSVYRSPVIAELPPLHGGLMGYLGYDVIREVERLPNVPPDDHGLPDAVMSVIGSLAAFDHWRQRVYLIESVPHARPRPTTSSTTPTTPRSCRVERRRSTGWPSRCRTCRSSRRSPARRCPTCTSTMADGHVPAGGRGRQGVHPRRRHLPGRARPALRHRARRRSVRRLPGAAAGQPEPVHVLPAPPRDHDRRLVARADGAGARPQGDLAADRRHAQAGHAPTSTTAASPPSSNEHPKEIAEHIMLVDLARNDVGRVGRVRHRARRRADDARALQPRDAPHVAGVGRPAPTGTADRRAAGDAAGGHGERGAEGAGDGDHRRARAGQARPVRRGRRLRRLSRQPRHRDRDPHDVRRPAAATARVAVQAGAGIVADSIPTTRTSSAATRPPRCWPRSQRRDA